MWDERVGVDRGIGVLSQEEGEEGEAVWKTGDVDGGGEGDGAERVGRDRREAEGK